MLSIAEWTDRALALSSPMKLTSSASFSPSIRISLRLKIHQAQAKNFCRVLDIRVTNIVDSDTRDSGLFRASIHLPVEITLGNGEHSVICSNSIEHFEVILNFL